MFFSRDDCRSLATALLSVQEGDVLVCRSVLGLTALLFFCAGGGMCLDFRFTDPNASVTEGQDICYSVHILNPALSNTTLVQTFIDPVGVETRLDTEYIQQDTTLRWTTPYNQEGTWSLRLEAQGVEFEKRKLVKETHQAQFIVEKMTSRRRPKYVILATSAVTSFITTILSYLMIDQKKARATKEKIDNLRREMLEAQRSGDKKRLKKLKRRQAEIMSLEADMMKSALKPALIYMVPFFIVFNLLRAQYSMIPIVELPFKIGFMQFFHQNNPISSDQLGFIAWYILCAYLFGSLYRKIMGVVH